MKVPFSISFIALLALLLSACNSATEGPNLLPPPNDMAQFQSPIVNGKPVTGDDRLNVVSMLHYSHYGEHEQYSSQCTGTLITPYYVLTAAHCIELQHLTIDTMRSHYRIGIGQSERDIRYAYEIDSFTIHPDYIGNFEQDNAGTDLALIKLKTPVPSLVATPARIIPKELDLTNEEIDNGKSPMASIVGFGIREHSLASSNIPSGNKYEAEVPIFAKCSLDLNYSKECASDDLTKYYSVEKGNYYVGGNDSNTCYGDSGGPLFYKKGNIEYIIGVLSVGMSPECGGYITDPSEAGFTYSGYIILSEHIPYIAGIVGNEIINDSEDCFNKKDDNGDKLVDCDDSMCHCTDEICDNKIDDSGNGLIDCDDPGCAKALNCQPENCTNGKDDNDNGLIDCDDAMCFSDIHCQPEICNNGKDDNDNGLIDCQEESCSAQANCASEICDNSTDDNDNGLIDCLDPQCAGQPICQPEICNDTIDNNDNGLVDCQEPACSSEVYCQPENCTNQIDDNANGLIDCLDPQCASAVNCMPEICNDEIDNNNDSMTDCNDPSCADSEYCTINTFSSETCAAMPKSPASPMGMFWLLLTGGLLWIRRSKE